MSLTVSTSQIIEAPLSKVWGVIRPLNFLFWATNVYNAVDSAEGPMSVGSQKTIFFMDYTKQVIRITEISELHNRISWTMVDSTPAVTYSSVEHSISLLRVTADDSTLIEFSSVFSKDAGREVLADAKCKHQDQIKGIAIEVSKAFNFFSTAEEVAKGHDLKQKTVLVTGVTAGLGFETARVLAARGAHIVGTARDDKKAKEFVEGIKKVVPNASVEAGICDLTSLKSVKAFADWYRAKKLPIHLLILNAGVMAPATHTTTEEKLEVQFGVNHVAHFLLTRSLLDIVKSSAPSRVVVVSSLAHQMTKAFNFEDPNFTKSYDKWQSYASSKIANILFARQLQAMFDKEKAQVLALSLHPGVIMTELGRHLSTEDRKRFIDRPPRFKSIPQGTATTIVAALSPDFAKIGGGHYLSDCGVVASSLGARDMKAAGQLWELTEKILAENGYKA